MKPSLFALALLTAAPLSAQAFTISGGANRGNFTVAGNLSTNSGVPTGRFMIVEQILDPDSTVYAVSCVYTRFSNVVRHEPGNIVSFDALGTCTVLNISGSLYTFSASNRFAITDNGPGGVDTLDVNYYGPSGIAVPGGAVDVGNYVIAP
jgi:hypothetical protein